MRVFYFMRSAKTTTFRLTTGVTQMSGRIRYCTTIFTSISHNDTSSAINANVMGKIDYI
jgi:hypothetical protein